MMGANPGSTETAKDIPAILRVLLVDDHPLLRQALRAVLEREKDIEIVGEAGNGCEAIEQAARLLPDVVIMDISMPEMDGLEATRRIKAALPQISVLALTVYDDDESIQGILQAGASGYLIKSVFGEEVIHAVRAVASGDMVLSPAIGKLLVKHAAQHPLRPVKLDAGEKLSARELEVLKLAARGMTNKDIASALGLTVRTVKGHLADIFSKLRVNSRTEAVITGLRAGFLSLEDIK